MEPTQPSPLLSPRNGRLRKPALSELDGSKPSASSAAACNLSDSGFALVRIPAGWFQMGCDTGQDNEQPVHRVWIGEFLLAAHQVTNLDYGRFLRDCASQSQPPFWTDPAFNHPEQPVVGVSWHEAVRYCEWLSASSDAVTSGRIFRLPTEAEWERASRAGFDGALFPWGDTPPQSLPGYLRRCTDYWQKGPEPVARAEPNAYGLYNMCDNVHEWCSDWYAPDYYAISPERNPIGPTTGTRRASRGGSWRHHIKMSRCAARSSIPPEFHYADYGFRVARDAAFAALPQSPTRRE
jgi:sulfatase modifying factor 1